MRNLRHSDSPPLLDESHFVKTFVSGSMASDVSEPLVDQLLGRLGAEITNILVIAKKQAKSKTGTQALRSSTQLVLRGPLEGALRNIQSIAAVLGASRLREMVRDLFASAQGDQPGVSVSRLSTLVELCEETIREAHAFRRSLGDDD